MLQCNGIICYTIDVCNNRNSTGGIYKWAEVF